MPILFNDTKKLTRFLADAKNAMGKPVLLALRPPGDLPGMEEFLGVQNEAVKAGLPVFYSLDGLAKAIYRVVAWNRRKKLHSF